MLDRVERGPQDAVLHTLASARAAAGEEPALAGLLGWVESYLMRAHPQLGRTGAVCPFTRQAGRIDTVRLAICGAGPAEEDRAFERMLRAFAELEAIPCTPGMEHFRTVIVGFPGCAGPDGLAMLARVQARHKFRSLRRLRMIGFMHEGNEAEGLWNPAFRPLVAPLPVMAIRHLVEHDAPFAARHPLLLVPYLARFRWAGLRRLREWRRRSA